MLSVSNSMTRLQVPPVTVLDTRTVAQNENKLQLDFAI